MMALYFQIISSVAIAYICMNMAMLYAWPSSTVLLFKSANTTLNRPMHDTEISLLGSLPAFGSLIGNPVAGLFLDRLGRKRSALLGSMMFVIAWSIIAAVKQVEVILGAVLIGGLGSIVFLVSTVFVSEICQESIRGAMAAAPMQLYTFGFVVSYSLGGYLDYQGTVYAGLLMSVAGLLVVALMKETPINLMIMGRGEEAVKSIAFYRREKCTSIVVKTEVAKMRRILNSGCGDVQLIAATVEVKSIPEIETKRKVSVWKYLKNSPSSKRELFVVMALQVAFIFQGMPVVLVYATPLFAEAVPSDVMSASTCSIVMGLVAFVSGWAGSICSDVFGRRVFIIYPSIITGVCCLVLGIQILTEWGSGWIVPIFIYLYTVFYVVGAGTVPLVVLAEVFVPEVKSILSMLSVEWAWALNFGQLFIFPLVVEWAGLAPVFLFFAVVCLATALFCHLYLPETRGLPLDAIQEVFRRN